VGTSDHAYYGLALLPDVQAALSRPSLAAGSVALTTPLPALFLLPLDFQVTVKCIQFPATWEMRWIPDTPSVSVSCLPRGRVGGIHRHLPSGYWSLNATSIASAVAQ
jgi:hypothetical protein